MSNRRKAIAGVAVSAGALIASLGFAQPSQAAGSGPFVIRNFGSNMCVQTDPTNSSTSVQLVQEPCTGSAAQKWTFDPIGGGNFHLVNSGNGACMRARAAADLSVVDTLSCSSISNETWNLDGQQPPILIPSQIISRVAGASPRLFVSGGSTAAGGKISVFHNSLNNPAEVFTIS